MLLKFSFLLVLMFLSDFFSGSVNVMPFGGLMPIGFEMRMAIKLEEKKSWLNAVYSHGYPTFIPVMHKRTGREDSIKIRASVHAALERWGDLKSGESLQAGILSFQQRNGLDTTGKLDNRLIRFLNQDLQIWLKKIQVNQQRMRQTSSSDSVRLIWVNIPDFSLRWMEDGLVKLQHRVIVGQPDWPTRTFQSAVTALHLHPSWYVPPRIWEKEMRAQVERNSGYLSRHHLEWENGKLRQRPGPWNALGTVKLVMPNRYLIFLHGTPYPTLFRNKKRMFSHGCVRVEDAERLASTVYTTVGLGKQAAFDQLISTGREQVINLPVYIPVLVSYWTVWVDEKGRMQNREDGYGWD
jgi:murein L,D-transpeptidase YcbB/YkuD